MKAQIRKLSVAAVFVLCVAGFAKADLAERVDAIIGKALTESQILHSYRKGRFRKDGVRS